LGIIQLVGLLEHIVQFGLGFAQESVGLEACAFIDRGVPCDAFFHLGVELVGVLVAGLAREHLLSTLVYAAREVVEEHAQDEIIGVGARDRLYFRPDSFNALFYLRVI